MMMPKTLLDKQQFLSTLTWLLCILCLLLGPQMALAQGSVSVSVSTSASSVTVGIGKAASFTATASAKTTPDNEWTVESGPTYSWSATPSPASCNPVNQSSTTVGATYDSPGTYPVNVTCTMSYIFIKSDPGQSDDGQKALVSGTNPPVTVNIYVIGGAIKGKNDIHYYCDPSYSPDWGHLSAALGQPPSTTYAWSITGPAQLVKDPAYPLSSTATYSGLHPGSTVVGDVTTTVTYTLNGVSVSSPPFPITVHAPVKFVILGTTRPIPIKSGSNAYGFDGETIHFQVLDGLKQTIPGGANWDESWTIQGNGQGPAPPGIGDILDSSGSSTDSFYNHGTPMPTSTTNAKGDLVLGPLTHKYSVTDEGGGASGGDVGCLIQTYTNVYYYTYGVSGNGL